MRSQKWRRSAWQMEPLSYRPAWPLKGFLTLVLRKMIFRGGSFCSSLDIHKIILYWGGQEMAQKVGVHDQLHVRPQYTCWPSVCITVRTDITLLGNQHNLGPRNEMLHQSPIFPLAVLVQPLQKIKQKKRLHINSFSAFSFYLVCYRCSINICLMVGQK